MDLMTLRQLSVDRRIQNASFSLQAGQTVGLIGPNGAGKSSLLHAIGGLLSCSGEVIVEGVPLGQMDRLERARKVALQPQFVDSAWALSVHDIVSMGRLPWGDFDQQIIHQAMRDTDVDRFSSRRIDRLSGGERARVWLARVLANQPRILLVDEPIANLDLGYQLQVMQLLADYAQRGNGVLVALHDLELAARFCDKLCLVDQGRVRAFGGIADVLRPELLSGIYRTDLRVDLDQQPPVVQGLGKKPG